MPRNVLPATFFPAATAAAEFFSVALFANYRVVQSDPARLSAHVEREDRNG